MALLTDRHVDGTERLVQPPSHLPRRLRLLPVKPATTSDAAPAATDKVLRAVLQTFPDMIDPQKSSFNNEIANLQMMYDGLTG